MTELQEKFLEALFGEAKGDPREAKKIAGYAQSIPIKTIMDNPTIQEQIRKRTEEKLTAAAVKAAFVLEDFLDEKTLPTIGDKERIKSAMDILDRAGFKPKEEQKDNTPNVLVYLPEKRS